MIDFKGAKDIRKLLSYQKLLIMESLKILRRSKFTSNDTLSNNILEIWYNLLGVT